MKSFQFQSLTTEAFLEFLKARLPEVFEKVDVHRWIYEPGLPEERHKPTSRLYEEVQQALDDYQRGIKPTLAQLRNWHRYQILAFLQGLPRPMPVEDCQYFENVLELEKRNDVAISYHFYLIAIASGYQAVLPRLERFMETIGRMLYILPVVRLMTQTEWSRGVVRPLFERVRDRHHQITAHQIDEILKRAEL